MPVIDTGTLVRPAFEAAEFTATKWDSAADKADFANALCRFIAADFPRKLFTRKLYGRLSLTFGHLAHHDIGGFPAEFFHDLRGNVAFIEQTLSWPCFGDPSWTYSDVECAVRARLRACDLLSAYRALRAVEIESVERALLLKRLQAKYADGAAPARPPVLYCTAPVRPRPARSADDQASLF